MKPSSSKNNEISTILVRHSSQRRTKVFVVSLFIILFICVGWLIANKGLIAGMAFVVIPVLLVVITQVFHDPKLCLWLVFGANYFVLGMTRYVPAPLGLAIDGLLFLTYVAVIFKNFQNKVDWSPVKNSLSFVALIWYAYVFLQLANPEAVNRMAWFYAMRGVGLYMLILIPLVFILMDDFYDILRFLNLWGVFTILGALWGIRQLMFGVDPWEQAWLDGGGHVTHILFGKLRIFSFFSDAGQFGASMGHSGVVFAILAMNVDRKKYLIRFVWYGIVSVIGFYAMLISGTRGAMAVPVGGFMLYFLLKNNMKIMLLGGSLGVGAFVFLKYTIILQSVYQINRMRTALDPNNASLQVRLANQLKLKYYLENRPLGGGLGSAGNWGQRFSPGTFLAETATDSWFVAIWAETGIIGLFFHLSVLVYVMLRGAVILMMKIKNEEVTYTLMALHSGIFGIILCSYGNGVLGQMPTALILYSSMAFVFQGEVYDKQMQEKRA